MCQQPVAHNALFYHAWLDRRAMDLSILRFVLKVVFFFLNKFSEYKIIIYRYLLPMGFKSVLFPGRSKTMISVPRCVGIARLPLCG